MSVAKKVLVMEDGEAIATLLKRDLPAKGYVVSSLGLRRSLHRVLGAKPDLVLLDLYSWPDNVPGICSAVHKVTGAPVIALVNDQRLCASETEGVEYHARAPNFAELVIRIHALLSRPRQAKRTESSQVIVVGGFQFEMETRRVVRDGKPHKLTPKATRLLHAFVTHPGETLTRRWLMKEVWDTDYTGDTRTLDVHVRWIRMAIENEPGSPVYLRTVRGVGYRFESPDSE